MSNQQSPKERWYLYGNDAALAEALLQAELDQAETAYERAWLLGHWLSLGGFEPVQRWLCDREPALQEHQPGRAAMLRLLQRQGDANPWLAVVPPMQRQRFLSFCDVTLASQESIDVWLGGGLGDQLECLAQLMHPAVEPLRPRLRCLLPLESEAALTPLLQRISPSLPRHRFAPFPPRALGPQPWFSWMCALTLLCRAGCWRPPIQIEPGLPHSNLPLRLVCCWRSKVDPEARHWAHLRSVPFVEVLRLYARWIPWCQRHGIEVVDLTAYRWEEVASLHQYKPTLRLMWPSIHSLADTAEWIQASRGVITVDTALVHLASWFGWPTVLLLHQHPDERWRYRRIGLQAPHPMLVLQQEHYNRWDTLWPQLLDALADWPWF